MHHSGFLIKTGDNTFLELGVNDQGEFFFSDGQSYPYSIMVLAASCIVARQDVPLDELFYTLVRRDHADEHLYHVKSGADVYDYRVHDHAVYALDRDSDEETLILKIPKGHLELLAVALAVMPRALGYQ